MTAYTMTRMICGKCGIEFDVPEPWRAEKEKTGEGWNCPNGHSRVYRETELDKVKKENEQLKLAKQRAEERERIARAEQQGEQRKRVRAENKLKRVKCGVCPDCNRSFTNLRRHMATKHGTKK